MNKEKEIQTVAKVLYQRKKQFLIPCMGECEKNSYEELVPALALLKKETEMVLSESAVKMARMVPVKDLLVVLEAVIDTWKKERGAEFSMKAMYKNFPASVMEMSDYELYRNAIIGYVADAFDIVLETGGSIRKNIAFDGEKKERGDLPEREKKKVFLDAGTMQSYYGLVKDLIGGKATLSENEKNIVSDAMGIAMANGRLEDILPSSIPQKDNLAFLVKEYLSKELPLDSFPLKNATDALRIAKEINHIEAEMVNGNPRKYKLTNREKNLLYSIMEQDACLSDNIKGKESAFKALIRGLNGLKNAEHKYPATTAVFDLVKANKTLPVSFMGRYYGYCKNKNCIQAASMLKMRPGIFAKNLLSLLEQCSKNDRMEIVEMFGSIVHKIPLRALFVLENHIQTRSEGKHVKTVMTEKGAYAYNKDEKPLPYAVKKRLLLYINMAIENELRARPAMGKVYVSKEYLGIPIPHDTKNEAGGMRPVTRGTRFMLSPETETIRAFIHWVGYDLDLSATILDENYARIEHISWTNLKAECGCHSGDIINAPAPDGASEFIDINLNGLCRNYEKAAYVAFQVHVFSGDTFKKTEECMFGFMERMAVNSGEIYDPKTVSHAFDLTQNSYFCIPMVLDVRTREIVWAEIPSTPYGLQTGGISFVGSCVENTTKGTAVAVMHVMNHPYPNMYDIITKNAMIRGSVTNDPAQADVIYGIEPVSDSIREVLPVPENATYYDMFARETWSDMF